VKYPEAASSILEWKRTLPENDKIIKTVIGFCNLNGGKLVIGVESDGTIVGIEENEIESGFITFFEGYEKRGLYPPEVIEGENFNKCILPRKSFPKKLIHEGEEVQKILSLFAITEEIAISDVMKALKMSRPTAGRRLAELTQRDILEQVGQGKATRYRKKWKS
jgi:predicted HTH transcriptional regulator